MGRRVNRKRLYKFVLLVSVFIIIVFTFISGCTEGFIDTIKDKINKDKENDINIPKYTVTYHGNNYTGGVVPSDTNNYLSGAEVTVLGPQTMVRTDYFFTHWNTILDNTGESYTEGDTFTIESSNVDLFAQWTSAGSYLTPPANLTAADGVSSDYTTVSWESSSGANEYDVYRNTSDTTAGADKINSTAAFAYDDNEATPGTIYYYWVRAHNTETGAFSTYSNSDSGYRTLSVPGLVSATDGANTYVTISWNTVDGAESYYVYRNNTDTTTGATELGPVALDFYNDVTASPGTINYYWVRAYNSSSLTYSSYSLSDSGYRMLSSPTGFTASDGTSETEILLGWNSVVGAASYEIYRNTSNNSSEGGTSLGSTTELTYTDTDATLVKGTRYYYFVRAHDDDPDHNSSYTMNYGYKKLPTPSISNDSKPSPGEVTIYYSGGGDFNQFRLYMSATMSRPANPTNTTEDYSYTWTGLESGNDHYFWVQTYNSTSQALSDVSSWYSVTPD